MDVIIDGQFGSTGKGLLAGYIANTNHYDIFVSSLSPNAGHTYRERGGYRVMVKQLPVGGVLNKRSQIYLTAGSIISPAALLQEMEAYDVDPDRVRIHPAAAVVEDTDIAFERDPASAVAAISTTASGTGSALARKILREAVLAGGHPLLAPMCTPFDLAGYLDEGCTALMETAQGVSLGINAGFYPHCTSRDISPSQALSDARLHPRYLGRVYLSLRTYPIRVGGPSGPFYDDSTETSWEALRQVPERTTVTNRIRRVATFSATQFRDALKLCRPDVVFLNFYNYTTTLREMRSFTDLLQGLDILVGTGACVEDIYDLKDSRDLLSFTGLLK